MSYFFKKIPKFASRKLFEYKYLMSNYFNTSAGINENQKQEIIINLTTHAARLSRCYLTIESLLRQDLKPTRIILWLSEQEINPQNIPNTLKRLQKRGLEIRFMKENYKSYNKLIFALREFPNAILVTADDDVYYPTWWLEGLYKAHLKTPNCIVCYRAHPILLNNADQLLPYYDWVDKRFLSSEPSLYLFPTGVSGILYFPNALHLEALNYAVFQELCPSGDDIWFKAMSLLKEIPCRKIFKKNIHFPTVLNTQKSALHHLNLYQGGNDLPIKRVFVRYNLINKLKNQSANLSMADSEL